MESYISVLVNTALIVSSITLALVFLVNPYPEKNALQNYRNSLWFLAIAYFVIGFLSIPYVFEGYTPNLPVDLTALSFETILFSNALIVLFNPRYVSRILLLKHIAPTFLFILLNLVFTYFWGAPAYPGIESINANYICHPTAILNGLFLLYCLIQIGYFTRIFRIEANNYIAKIEDFYSETDQIKLVWVRYNFYSALAFCFLIISSIIVASDDFSIVVTMVNIVFNTVFGLSYIQYPKTYNKIEALMSIKEEEAPSINGRLNRGSSWADYRAQILFEKLYLRRGLTIEEMAHSLKIDRLTLSHFIHSEEGVNFNAWINALRVEEAKQLLSTSSIHSLGHIAEMVGFSESSSFSRQFKLLTNESPSSWRHLQRRR